MAVVIISTPARDELFEIIDGIADVNPGAAIRYHGQFEKAIATLVRFPFAGRERPELELSGLRTWIVRPYLIVYRATKDRVDIAHIVHGARYLPDLLCE